MANNTSTQNTMNREYIVRVPKSTRKHYHMMRFSSELGSDFFKTWTQCKMERENNLKEFRLEEEMPKFGAGSEFGREQREEARRKRYGINVRKYRSEDQPWMLAVDGKSGKKFKGIREGGVADNVSWYVFMQGKDGSFEAYPIDEWYNFQPIQRYKSLSAEEAEEEFVRRDKIMNYFQVMYEKKFRKDGVEPEEEEGKKKGSKKKNLILSEMDEWFSDNEEGDDEEERDGENDDDDDGGGKKKRNLSIKGKRKQGGKRTKRDGAESDNSCIEESDEYDEGAEHDYISSDSSDSDQQNEEVVGKDLAGVEEGDALKKLLASDEEDEEEENKESEEEEEEGDEENEDKEKKKKKKKKKDKKSADSEDSSDYSSDENKKKKQDAGKQSERKHALNDLKRKMKENPLELQPESKKLKLDTAGVGSSSSNAVPSCSDSMEEAIKRYLMRKPMTTTELLKMFKKKKDMSSEQLVTSIAQILKRVNPVKRMIKGKMYLSLKST